MEDNKVELVSRIQPIEFTDDVVAKINDPLVVNRAVAPGKEHLVHYLPGGIAYMKGRVVAERANEIFGLGNWAVSPIGEPMIVDRASDDKNEYVTVVLDVAVMIYGKLYGIGVGAETAILRIPKGGKAGSRGDQMVKAVKGAETDGFKRVMRRLGPAFGSDLHKIRNEKEKKEMDGKSGSSSSSWVPAGGSQSNGAQSGRRDQGRAAGAIGGRQSGAASQRAARANEQTGVKRNAPSAGTKPDAVRSPASQQSGGSGRNGSTQSDASQVKASQPTVFTPPQGSPPKVVSSKADLIQEFYSVALQMEEIDSEEQANQSWYERYGFSLDEADENSIVNAIALIRERIAQRQGAGVS